MNMLHISNLPFASMYFAAFTVAQTCYYTDGRTEAIAMDGHRYTPCDTSAKISSCCHEYASCLDNSLCLHNGLIFRPACTDRDWGLGCVTICSDQNPSGVMPLMPCSEFGNSFACEVTGTGSDCATNLSIGGGSGIKLRVDQVFGLGVSTVVTISPTQALDEVLPLLPTSCPPASSSLPEDHHRHLRHARRILIGVGAGTGIPLLLCNFALAFLLLRELRNSRRGRACASQTEEKTHEYSDQPGDEASGLPLTQGILRRQELQSEEVQELQSTVQASTYELGDQRCIVEIP